MSKRVCSRTLRFMDHLEGPQCCRVGGGEKKTSIRRKMCGTRMEELRQKDFGSLHFDLGLPSWALLSSWCLSSGRRPRGHSTPDWQGDYPSNNRDCPESARFHP